MSKKPDGLVAVADLAEAVDHMNLKSGSARKENAKAVIRAAIQYAAMKRAGFKMVPSKSDAERSIWSCGVTARSECPTARAARIFRVSQRACCACRVRTVEPNDEGGFRGSCRRHLAYRRNDAAVSPRRAVPHPRAAARCLANPVL